MLLILATEDDAIEAGNIASSSSRNSGSNLWENAEERQSYSRVRVKGEQWLMNYREASIYLEEGANNEKFDTHPKSQAALPAYLIGRQSYLIGR